MSQAASPRLLVAGIGNVFLGDDGFGVEVVARLAQRPLPEGVEVADFGIRGFDLAYALMEGYDFAVLVDALPRGGHPGELFVVEPDLERLEEMEGPSLADGHGMDPVAVLKMVRQFGGQPPSGSKEDVVAAGDVVRSPFLALCHPSIAEITSPRRAQTIETGSGEREKAAAAPGTPSSSSPAPRLSMAEADRRSVAGGRRPWGRTCRLHCRHRA